MQDLSDGMKSAESEQNNARGASPHPPLDASSRARGPRHIRHHSKLRTRSLCCRQDSEHDAPPPKHLTKHPGRRRTSDTPRCFLPTRTAAFKQHIKVVACAVIRRCTAPDRLSQAENQPPQSATSRVVSHCRCRKRRLPTPSHTAPMVAMQHRPPWSATSRQTATKRRPLATNKKVDAST